MIRLTLLLALSILAAAVFGQPAADPRLQAINTVVQGYNEQNYHKMKQPWFLLGKVVVPKGMLKKEFKPVYKRLGKATIDTITYTSKYNYVAKLKMEKSPERVFWQFIFNDKGKLEGFGNAYPPMIYRRYNYQSFGDKPLDFKIDSIIHARYVQGKADDFNGSVLVTDLGEAIYKNNFGFADYNRKTKLNDTSLFELASCSKQFTAFAIMLLEKKGRLQYNDSIQKFIPDFPYHQITIEHLLTHTSGLPDYERLLEKTWDKTKFATNADVLSEFKKYLPPVLFQPGERFEYSNAGYVFLSMIIEKASGISYERFLSANIFRPLGMKHTRVYNTRRYKNEKLDNYAYGYVYSNKLKRYVLPDSLKEYDEVIYQDAITGDGTVNSCIADLLLWERSLVNYRLLDKKEMQRAYTRYKLNNGKEIGYGYGFFIHEGGNTEKLVFHTGGWPGYVCIILRVIEHHKAVIILSNNSYGKLSFMADDITALLIGDK